MIVREILGDLRKQFKDIYREEIVRSGHGSSWPSKQGHPREQECEGERVIERGRGRPKAGRRSKQRRWSRLLQQPWPTKAAKAGRTSVDAGQISQRQPAWSRRRRWLEALELLVAATIAGWVKLQRTREAAVGACSVGGGSAVARWLAPEAARPVGGNSREAALRASVLGAGVVQEQRKKKKKKKRKEKKKKEI